jgi:hypothetical protein
MSIKLALYSSLIALSVFSTGSAYCQAQMSQNSLSVTSS